MKKNLIIIFFTIIFCSSASADKLLKNGFINGNMDYAELQEVNDPKNKIILIIIMDKMNTTNHQKIVFGKMV